MLDFQGQRNFTIKKFSFQCIGIVGGVILINYLEKEKTVNGDSNFLNQDINVDETWINFYDPKTKQQSMEWKNSESPKSKKFRSQ